jgi:hypothetical protein
MINRMSKVKRNPDVVARPLAEGEGGVLLHLKTGAYHGVNQIGLMIWERIDGERTIDELIDEIRREVSDAPPHLADDVSAFLEAALSRDLVQLSN